MLCYLFYFVSLEFIRCIIRPYFTLHKLSFYTFDISLCVYFYFYMASNLLSIYMNRLINLMQFFSMWSLHLIYATCLGRYILNYLWPGTVLWIKIERCPKKLAFFIMILLAIHLFQLLLLFSIQAYEVCRTCTMHWKTNSKSAIVMTLQ